MLNLVVCFRERDIMIRQIIDLIKNNGEVKVVSFDVFDTLLLRTVRQPKDVFGVMYRVYPQLFPEYTDADDWINVRQMTEKRCRQEMFRTKGTREVKLKDIYECIPDIYINKKELMDIEVECEKEVCFLNNEIYETIMYIKKEMGVRIILCSDMYLEQEQIKDILQYNGFDMEMIDKIYVSCEYESSKRSEKLYEKVLLEEEILSKELFHIGDNYYSDIGVATKLGIPNFYYDLISGASYKYPFLEMENLAYEGVCSDIYTLRVIAGSLNSEENFWFQLGAMILGPFMTYATEWIIDQAEKNDIRYIRPLMREGKFLAELLQKTAKDRKSDVSIEPLYVSRLATFSAKFEQITEKEIVYLFETYNITLRDVFRILKIEDVGQKYQKYLSKKTVDLQVEKVGEINLYDEIIKYLTSVEICKLIRKRNKGSFEKFEKYLRQMGLTENSITVDIGWRGSMQNAITSMLREKGYDNKLMHLLFVSKPEVGDNLSNRCDIRGFVGNFGSARKNTYATFARLYEMFLLCDEGTTVGYELRDKHIVPILKCIEYPQWQISAMHKIQDGIKAYQTCYFELAKKKTYIRKWKDYNIHSHYLLERLCCLPLKNEADLLRKIVYDQNFGADSFSSIIEDDVLEQFMNMETEKYYAKFNSMSVFWNSGLNVLKDPLFYFKQWMYLGRQYRALAMLLLVQSAIRESQKRNKKIVLVGAGGNLPLFLKYIVAMNEKSRIEAIVDNNDAIQGAEIAGIKICPVETYFNTNLYLCTLMQKNFNDSLFLQLKKFTNDKMIFIGYYNDLE